MKVGISSLDKKFMTEAITLAREKMTAGEGGPFGAVITRGDEILARGWNRVTSTNDPTAHAEIVCIRRACEAVNDFDLSGCVLYSSCEPCPMCLAAVYWAGIERVVFGADRHDAAKAGFNDDLIYRELGMKREKRSIRMQCLMRDAALEGFRLWEEFEDKILY
ncbi:MAG: nucleoside deaminase [Thermodesulfobacteriota bacterium]